MSANLYVIEDYENEPSSGPKKQTQTNPILSAVGGFRKAKMNLKSLARKSGHTLFAFSYRFLILYIVRLWLKEL